MLEAVLLLAQFINPPSMHKPATYTHAVKVANCQTVFVSGQVALDAKSELVGGNDFALQAEQVFRNLEEVLRASGAGFKDVVKLNSYVVGLSPERLKHFRAVRGKFMSGGNPPASTLVGVQALARPEFLLEVEAIACAK
ncbi:MAG: RidA family protein [Gammaproteobacteria bacterium]